MAPGIFKYCYHRTFGTSLYKDSIRIDIDDNVIRVNINIYLSHIFEYNRFSFIYIYSMTFDTSVYMDVIGKNLDVNAVQVINPLLKCIFVLCT